MSLGKLQIEIPTKYHYTPIWMAEIQNTDKDNANF